MLVFLSEMSGEYYLQDMEEQNNLYLEGQEPGQTNKQTNKQEGVKVR